MARGVDSKEDLAGGTWVAILSVFGDEAYYRAAEYCIRSLVEHTSLRIAVGCDRPENIRVSYPGRVFVLPVDLSGPALRPRPFMGIFDTVIAIQEHLPSEFCLLIDADCVVMTDIVDTDLGAALGEFDFGMVEQTTVSGSGMGREEFLEHFTKVSLPTIDSDPGTSSLDVFRYWNSGVVLARSSALLELAQFARQKWAQNPAGHLVGDHMVADQDYFQYWGSVRKPGSIITLPKDWNHCQWWDDDFPNPAAKIHHYSNFCLGPDETIVEKMASDCLSPGVTAAVITHNSYSQVSDAIAAARRSGVATVLVWDNGSTDQTVDLAREAGAQVVESPENVGFACAANALATIATTSHVLFLNPDVRLDSETLNEAVIRLQTPGVIASGPGQEIPGLGPVPFLQPGYTPIRLLLEIAFPRVSIVEGRGLLGVIFGRFAPRWNWASGACLMVNRDAFLALGGFDADYFLYMEDVAFGAAVSKSPFTMVPTNTMVSHAMASGSDIPVSDRDKLLTRARIRFAVKHFGGLTGLAARVIGTVRGIV
jgi:GT2 family glycosyltransferase